MSLESLTRQDDIILLAPRGGAVRFLAPAALTGELEIFRAGDEVGVVTDADGDARVEAQADGFVLRQLVPDGADVAPGTPILTMRAL